MILKSDTMVKTREHFWEHSKEHSWECSRRHYREHLEITKRSIRAHPQATSLGCARRNFQNCGIQSVSKKGSKYVSFIIKVYLKWWVSEVDWWKWCLANQSFHPGGQLVSWQAGIPGPIHVFGVEERYIWILLWLIFPAMGIHEAGHLGRLPVIQNNTSETNVSPQYGVS